jgi:hypothetical protein
MSEANCLAEPYSANLEGKPQKMSTVVQTFSDSQSSPPRHPKQTSQGGPPLCVYKVKEPSSPSPDPPIYALVHDLLVLLKQQQQKCDSEEDNQAVGTMLKKRTSQLEAELLAKDTKRYYDQERTSTAGILREKAAVKMRQRVEKLKAVDEKVRSSLKRCISAVEGLAQIEEESVKRWRESGDNKFEAERRKKEQTEAEEARDQFDKELAELKALRDLF